MYITINRVIKPCYVNWNNYSRFKDAFPTHHKSFKIAVVLLIINCNKNHKEFKLNLFPPNVPF